MKILCVTGSINQGGAEYQILALANLLKKSGHDVQVLALTNYSYYLDYIKDHDIHYGYIDNQGSKLIRLLRAIRAIKKAEPEIVIAYAKIASLVTIVTRLLSFMRFKLITSERTSLILPRYDFFYYHASLLSSAIVVNSLPKSKYITKRFPFLKNKVIFIPNLIDIERFSRVRRAKSSPGFTRLTYIGRLSPEKNLLSLIRAIGIIAAKGFNVHLNLYGEAHNLSYLSEIGNLVNVLNLNKVIKYEGAIREIAEAYSQTDIFCLVSLYEGFSNVLAEALVCGIPILASDIPENRYLVEDSKNGFLVIPESVDSIANGIEKCIHLSREEKERIFNENKAKAKIILDPTTISVKYLELINDR